MPEKSENKLKIPTWMSIQCLYLYRVSTRPAQPRWRGWQSGGWWRCVPARAAAAVIFNIQVFMPISSRKPAASILVTRRTTLLRCYHRHHADTDTLGPHSESEYWRCQPNFAEHYILYIAYKHLPASKQINLNESLNTFHKSENWTHFQRATRFYWQVTLNRFFLCMKALLGTVNTEYCENYHENWLTHLLSTQHNPGLSR